MKRFAGPEFATTVELINSAQHDRQKFYIDDMRDWRQLEDGTIEILVKWRGFEETWEPAEELFKDVPEKVMKFLRENSSGNPPLQELKIKLQPSTRTTATNKAPQGRGKSKNRGSGRGRGRRRGRGRGGRGRGQTHKGRGRGTKRARAPRS